MLGLTADFNTGLLDSLADRAEDLRPGLALLAPLYRERQRRVFATRGRGTWAPNKQSTIRRKKGNRPLVFKGGLLDSFTEETDRYAVEKITADSIIVGSKNPVANLHQKRHGKTPARPPSPPTTAAERQQYASTLLDFWVEG